MRFVFPVTIANGKCTLQDPAKFARVVKSIGNSDNKELILQDVEKDRSDNQRKYYYGVIIEITKNHFGYSKDDMHIVWCEKFLSYTVKGLNGQEVKVFKTASQLNTKQTEEFHEQIRQHCLIEHQLNIPLPNEVEGEYDFH